MFYYSHIRRPSIRSYRVLFILTRQCRHYLHPSKSVCYRLSSRVSAYSLFVQWPQNSQTFTYQPGSLVNVHSLFSSVVVPVQSHCVSLLVTVSSLQHALFMGSCHFCGASLRAGSLFRVREKVLTAEPPLREENGSSPK